MRRSSVTVHTKIACFEKIEELLARFTFYGRITEEQERTNEENVPAPRCENDAAPHVAASGVNGEDDNCGGGDDVHGERELGRKAAREGGRLRAAVLQSQWRWWRQRRGKTVGLEKRGEKRR